jgi:hypothetical protein
MTTSDNGDTILHIPLSEIKVANRLFAEGEKCKEINSQITKVNENLLRQNDLLNELADIQTEKSVELQNINSNLEAQSKKYKRHRNILFAASVFIWITFLAK